MVTALAVVMLSVSATLLLLLPLLLRRGESDRAGKLIGSLPSALSTFLTRVGMVFLSLRAPRHAASPGRRENRVGARLRFIRVLLPESDEWRVEEMMDHRNQLRRDNGRVPRYHYLRLFRSACTIRWETWRDPERRIE